MRQHRRGIVIGVLGTVIVAGILLAPFLLTHHSDLPFERFYGNAMVGLVSRVLSSGSSNPVAGNTRATQAGRDAYVGSCAVCHGANGDGRGAFGQATYPQATDLLSDEAKEMSDGQLFWITKNGLSFTGMPGFGEQYTDQDIWSIVNYIRQLQRGQAAGIDIPAPTSAQLSFADPSSNDAAARGAAVYFAQGCQYCHGAVGNAPGDLGLHEGEMRTVRRGERGMPAYGTDLITDVQLSDLSAYIRTFARGGERD